jgi:hypothetical protein
MRRRTTALRAVLATLTLLSVVTARQASPQGPKSQLPELYPFFVQRLSKGDYLGLLLSLRRDEAGYRADERTRGTFLELMSVINSQVGNYAEAHAYLDEFARSQEPPAKDVDKAPFDGYEPRPAIEAIKAAADSHQVVMINEEHDTPMHRAFTTRLLPILYAKGFRYLAAETLNERDADLQRRGYPTHKSGFYTADPVYGDMIRAAIRLGFKVVAYEYVPRGCTNPPDNPDFCQDERERGQAQNLYDRILKDDPKAKVLVHVGRGHNQEVNLGRWAMMGWHFREITKIDPFTIDQLQMSERSRPEFESPLYRYATRKWHITEPTVFRSKEGKLWGRLGNDLVVFHPRARYEEGRPTWLLEGGMRAPRLIDFKRLRLPTRRGKFVGQGPVLVQAFVAGEDADAIPADQIVLRPGEELPALVVPKLALSVRAVDEAGAVLGQYEARRRIAGR